MDNELKSTESRATCYFFFKDDAVKQKSVTHALSALLHQLFSQRKFLIQHATQDYKSEGIQLPKLFHKLWTILVKAATDPKAGEVVCILDALDECEESDRYNIIKALSAFYKEAKNTEGNPSKFKFLATSRPYRDIERRFAELTHDMPAVHLQGERESKEISEEINHVIHYEAHNKIGVQLNLKDLEKNFLERKLSSMPHRTYLWLKLILEEIRSRTSVTQKGIREIVSNLPTTLEAAYEAILKKSSDKERARKLLCIVIASVRSLTLNEMNIALAIEDHHRSSEDLDLEDEIRFKDTVRHLCGLFVSIIDKKVYLIHQTAKEFLLAKPEMCSGTWKYSFEPAASELIVARGCITYLLFVDYSCDLDVEGESKIKHHTDKNHYLGYAASHWAIHFQKAQAKAEYKMLQLILKICDTQSQQFQNWFCVYWNLVHPYRLTPKFISSIMAASYFGHEAVAKLLLETGKVDVDSKDSDGRTPLWWAAHGGHEAVARLLLETGEVDVDSKNHLGRTPLWIAARGGHEAVAKLLLETGKVDVDSKDHEGQTPLSIAAMAGHEAVAKLLLEIGKVDVDLKNHYGQTPLSTAAMGGHEAVAKLLLETGKVDVDSKDSDGGTPLSTAAGGGHEAVAKLLLETGKIDIDSKNHFGRTPLSMAAAGGHEAVAKLLLKTGKADINSKDNGGRTPLSWTAMNGSGAVAKLLLETGKVDDVDLKDEFGKTPLSWVAERGFEAVAKLLLETGKVDVEFKDSKGGQTPLSRAAWKGHEAVAKLLLETGKVNVDSKDNSGRTPLSWTGMGRKDAVAKLLLETGKVDVNSEDSSGRTPLSWAAGYGREAVVKVLLETGKANVNIEDNNWQRPLIWAKKGGHKAVIEMLRRSASN